MTAIGFHQLADIFPLVEGAEFDELVADIKAHGLREKIDLHQGKIVEGRNRYRALQRLGIDPSADPTKYFRKAIYAHTVGGEIAPHEQSNDDRVRAYIISKNIHRRHLTVEQKRDLIAKVIAAKPEASDRQIAKQVKADHKTVAKARKKAEATGEVSPVEKRTGADGKARKQPAKKTAKQELAAKRRARASRKAEREAEDRRAVRALAGYDEHEAEARAVAADLVNANRDLAGAVLRHLSSWCGDGLSLQSALEDALGEKPCTQSGCGGTMRLMPVENAPPPDVGAEIMKAKMATLDDDLDIPESLRRPS
jgi:hypothetical protein